MLVWVAVTLAAVFGALGAVACLVGLTGTPLGYPAALALGATSYRCWRYADARVVEDVYGDIGVDPDPADDGGRTPGDDWHREGWDHRGEWATEGEWTGDDWTWADGEWAHGEWADREGRRDGAWTEDERVGPGRRVDPDRGAVALDRETAEAYRVLGVPPEADAETVRRAYRERVKETHPDAGGSPEAFRRVRWAYERVRERKSDRTARREPEARRE
ncbi:J domain-containing protein [Halomarina ordinaria]|uniref:J domain-containing protein n=1 Tax=Halomarina ordinaria TaxID=3033939 RepID=A0ABD5U8K8_9EURY|nr:J domain-containing protein [Halomarina sp. PSRA2]